jgi:hypothetical protein
MTSIDNKTLDELKEEYKDILENPAIESALELKRMGDRGLILSNPDYREISDEEYANKAIKGIPKLKKYLDKIF